MKQTDLYNDDIALLKRFYDNSPAATKVLNDIGEIVYINKAYTAMWGIQLNDVKKLIKNQDYKSIRSVVNEYITKAINGETIVLDPAHCVNPKDSNQSYWVRTLIFAIDSCIQGVKLVVIKQIDATHEVKKEERVKFNEERFKALYNHAPIPYQSCNDEGVIIDVNPAWLETLGYDLDEVVGHSFIEFVHADYIDQYQSLYPEFMKQGFFNHILFKLKHKHGHYIDVLYQGRVGYDTVGKFMQSYCVFQDVTQQIQTEKLLHEEERKNASMLSNLPGLVFRCKADQEWTMFYLSEGCEALTGYKAEKLLQNKELSYNSIIHPKDKGKVREIVSTAITSEPHYEIEYRIITCKGAVKWVWEKGFCNQTNDEMILEGFITDISDKVTYRKQLEKDEIQLIAILDTFPHYVWVKDSDGIFIACNRKFEDIYGAKREEIIGKTDYDFVPKEKADYYREIDNKALELGSSVLVREDAYKASTNEIVEFETFKSPLRDSKGKLIGVLGVGTDITDRLIAQADLIESRQQINAIFDDQVTFLGVVDLEGNIIDCNQTSLDFFKCSREDVIGKNLLDTPWNTCCMEESEDFFIKLDKVKKGIPVNYTIRFLINSGEVHFHNISIRPIKNEAGEVYRFLVEGIDTTEQRLVAEQLRLSEKRYIKTQELGHVGSWEFNLITKEFWGSQETKRIYGLDSETNCNDGKLVKSTIVDTKLVDNALKSLIENNAPYDAVFELKPLDRDETRKVHSVAELEMDDNGMPVKIVGSIHDITELIKAQEEIRKTKQRLELATDSASIGIWELDLVNDFLVWDDRMFEIYGVEKNQFKNCYKDWENSLHPEDIDKTITAFNLALKTGKFETEFRIIRNKNEVRHIAATATYIMKNEKPIAMIGANIDISEQKANERKIDLYKKHLETLVDARTKELLEANRELESFSYSISHDLRAPLRAIIGFCSILNEGYSSVLDEEGIRLLSVVSDNAKIMNQLISDILNLSRITRKEMVKHNCNMNIIISECLEMLKRENDIDDYEIIIHDLIEAKCDKTSIRLVWKNLIENAIKYSSKSKVKKIEITSFKEDDRIIYQIQDWGAGFDSKYVDKLFGVFQRLHKIDQYPGTGVGLALCKRVINKHNGKIRAKGEINAGATFQFFLPILSINA